MQGTHMASYDLLLRGCFTVRTLNTIGLQALFAGKR